MAMSLGTGRHNAMSSVLALPSDGTVHLDHQTVPAGRVRMALEQRFAGADEVALATHPYR
jgi:hypothetical protein